MKRGMSKPSFIYYPSSQKLFQTSVSVSYFKKQNGEDRLAIVYRCLSRQNRLILLRHLSVSPCSLMSAFAWSLFLLLMMNITILHPSGNGILTGSSCRLWHHWKNKHNGFLCNVLVFNYMEINNRSLLENRKKKCQLQF